MTECDEVAAAMPLMPANYTLDDTRRQVRMMMPGESETVIDNVAWSLYQRRKRELPADQGYPPIKSEDLLHLLDLMLRPGELPEYRQHTIRAAYNEIEQLRKQLAQRAHDSPKGKGESGPGNPTRSSE